MMKVSQNLYAETLLKAIGAARGGRARPQRGRAAARDLRSLGNTRAATCMADGSGLSRYDYVTAEMIVTLLERMHKDPRHRDAFVATLPIAGKDGTISTRMRGTRAEANAVAKTGSISNVRALSGYVRTRDGETLAFSILANNFTDPGRDGELDRGPRGRDPRELHDADRQQKRALRVFSAPSPCSWARRRRMAPHCA